MKPQYILTILIPIPCRLVSLAVFMFYKRALQLAFGCTV